MRQLDGPVDTPLIDSAGRTGLERVASRRATARFTSPHRAEKGTETTWRTPQPDVAYVVLAAA